MQKDKEINITRILNAPRQLVFDAWTQVEHLAQWWGAKDFTVTHCEADVKPGGIFRICMVAPEGVSFWVRGNYREIKAPERLVFDCALENEKRNHNALWTVLFEEENGKTKLTIHEVLFDIEDARGGAETGLNQCIDRLAQHLAAIQ